MNSLIARSEKSKSRRRRECPVQLELFAREGDRELQVAHPSSQPDDLSVRDTTLSNVGDGGG
jgi:hypothetical protein